MSIEALKQLVAHWRWLASREIADRHEDGVNQTYGECADELENAIAEAIPSPQTWQPTVDQIRSEWAMRAVEYARQQVMPNAGPDDAGTPYERGLVNRLAATYRDGYLAACEQFAVASLQGGPAKE